MGLLSAAGRAKLQWNYRTMARDRKQFSVNIMIHSEHSTTIQQSQSAAMLLSRFPHIIQNVSQLTTKSTQARSTDINTSRRFVWRPRSEQKQHALCSDNSTLWLLSMKVLRTHESRCWRWFQTAAINITTCKTSETSKLLCSSSYKLYT